MFRFTVLGPLQVRVDEEVCVLRGPKLRRLCATLLLRTNEVVDVDTLAEELWDGDLRAVAQSIVRTHVYHLRRALSATSAPESAADRLCTEAGGYHFRVEDNELDSRIFVRQVDQGRLLLCKGDAEGASQTLCSALSLWQGAALAGTSVGPILAPHIAMLNELRSQALELRIEADLHLGRYRDVIPELRALIIENQLNEWLRGKLMIALWHSGRRNEALATFREARSVLRNELGVEPSTELQRMHRSILAESMPSRGLKSGARG